MIFYKGFILWIIFITLPLQGVIAFLVVVTSGFPILYRQKRVGKHGRIFVLYKFRTMARGAERLQNKLRSLNEAHGPVFKMHHDPRYSPIGKFLAHTGLDELPQLYNVLVGDMALFGPRPLPIAESAKLKPWQRERHQVKPGLISPWIVEGYHRQSFASWMKSDVLYAQQKSIHRDGRLFWAGSLLLCRLFYRECTALLARQRSHTV